MPSANRPPGPRSSLSQLRYLRDPFPWMVKIAQEYSDPVTVPILGMGDMVLTWSPDGVRAVFSADPDTFTPGANEALALIVGRSSLFMMSGAELAIFERLWCSVIEYPPKSRREYALWNCVQ